MTFELDERVEAILKKAGWTEARAEQLYDHQKFSDKNDLRVNLCQNLNGLTLLSPKGQRLDFFRPEGDHPILPNMRIEDVLERALQEAQDFEGLRIDDPVFLAYVTTSPSPYSLYVDKHFQFFAIGEGIFYVGRSLEQALLTVLFCWSRSRYVNIDGSLVDLNEEAVPGKVVLG